MEAILAATSRVLVEEGYDHASTNRIAEVAGVSVGSLYQYFPNKQSLVVALLDAHGRTMIAALDAAYTPVVDRKAHAAVRLDACLRAYVDAIAAAHTVAPELHRVLAPQARLLHDGVLPAFELRAEALALEVIDGRADSEGAAEPKLVARMMRTLVQAVAETTSHMPAAEQKAMRAEVVRLLGRYLRAK